MATWTDITNAQVAAGAPITTALMTALRDNVTGIAQRASGAPKIFGVPYDFQEFTTSGTWTKPANAEAGDVVIVQVVGGGGGSTSGRGGGSGGGGCVQRFEDISDLGATEAVTVGSGGGTNGNGGLSRFGTDNTFQFLEAGGGQSGGNPAPAAGGYALRGRNNTTNTNDWPRAADEHMNGGRGAEQGTGHNGSASITGGGGGADGTGAGGASMMAGNGGFDVTGFEDGEFPGGGGVGGQASSGGDGVVRVWCIKEA